MSHHAHEAEGKLIRYIQDAHSLELNSLLALKSMVKNTDDSELRQMLDHHITETERHALALEERLEELGEKPGIVRQGNALVGSLFKGVLDQIRNEKPAKNVRDGYLTEQMEIVSYELLQRLADRAGDTKTADIARRNLADEKAMADKLAGTWDKAIDLTLEEDSVSV